MSNIVTNISEKLSYFRDFKLPGGEEILIILKGMWFCGRNSLKFNRIEDKQSRFDQPN